MELTIYTKMKQRGPGLTSVERILAVNRKGGYLLLNVRLIEEFGMKGGERVLIAQDNDSRNDWYITVGADLPGGSKAIPVGKGRDGRPLSMRLQNKSATAALLDFVKAEYSASFLVATRSTRMQDGRDWYRILTATPKRKR